MKVTKNGGETGSEVLKGGNLQNIVLTEAGRRDREIQTCSKCGGSKVTGSFTFSAGETVGGIGP